MRLRASCELRFDSLRETPAVVMLRARHGAAQRVIHDALEVLPAAPTSEFTDVLGNRCDRLIAPAGELVICSEIVAEVTPDVAVDTKLPRTAFSQLPSAALHFTLPSRYCPADKLRALALEVTHGCQPGYAEVQAIRDYVHEQLKYQYGVSNASTDALETLQMGAGVCRDFSHVAITLCRSIDIPARMVVGYLHRREPMDLHAWFEAHVGGAWYTFDPSEAELRGGRIVLAAGRDAADVAFVTDYGALALRNMRVSVCESVLSAPRPVPLRAAG
ncbi:MAG: transglutaminase domain protein [Myxococcaceae bacterium]|nr:transglutaminase domain protein [Myxococcaceae bacterium]